MKREERKMKKNLTTEFTEFHGGRIKNSSINFLILRVLRVLHVLRGLSLAILLSLTACNDFFHDLFPPDEDRILSFKVSGQEGKEVITNHDITLTVEKGTPITSLIPKIELSPKADIIPVTLKYIQAAFPNIDIFKEALALHRAEDITAYVENLIRENKDDFKFPTIDISIDFSGPVDFIVIAAQGNMRRYTVKVVEDTGEPRLVNMRFSKYDNPELVSDALCILNESTLSIYAVATYPVEMDYLSFALVPSFEIFGDSIEIDGNEIQSGINTIQFSSGMGLQNKTITVHRKGETKDYELTVMFEEDPDTVRSITDFRFTTGNNPQIAVNAVGAIVNSDSTGVINVQVFYSGATPAALTPRFVSPGNVTVAGAPQTTGVSSHDFSSPLEYRVVSRNGQYIRTYTVNVEMISLTANAPRITSFKFNQSLNHDLVKDVSGEIGESLILIDVFYGGISAPELLIPEFSAQGVVTVNNSVQVSGASPQSFFRQVKYTVTNPSNPLLTRDYWVQVRLIRDTSSNASITAFGFYPEDNPGLADAVVAAKIDQGTGKINIFAPLGSGVTTRLMVPRFTATGQVNVDGVIQTSSVTSRMFDSTVTYTVVSANGSMSKNYQVTVRELKSTIYVNQNAWGDNDGTSWQNAFRSLQAACEAAALSPDDVPKEIWIVSGTYKPNGTNNRDEYFLLAPNTSYIGGFAGHENAKSERNAAANPVIISGDLGGGVLSNNLFGSFNGTTARVINDDITFEDMSFTSARAQGSGDKSGGAAINVNLGIGAQLRITDCSFENLSASSATGGVIRLTGTGNAVIDNVKIESITGGGAIFSNRIPLEITDSIIKSITGAYGIYSSGGLEAARLDIQNITGEGINVNGGAMNLSGITASGISLRSVYYDSPATGVVIDNSNFNNSGDIYINSSSSAQIIDTNITNVRSGIDNGLYTVSSGNITINGVTVDTVPNGRGMSISVSDASRTAWIVDSVIKNCATTQDGGGIYFTGSGRAELENITIEPISNGGAIYSDGVPLKITDSVIKNVTGTYGIYSSDGLEAAGLDMQSITGQGIYVTGGAMTLSGITASGIGSRSVYYDSSTTGAIIRNSNFNICGDIYINNSSSAQITDTNITNVHSGTDNGLYAVSSGNITINGVTVDTVPNGRGMSISVSNSSRTAWVTNSVIKNCTTTGNGGGIYFTGSGRAELENVTIEAVNNGGAIYSNGNPLEIIDSVIKNVTGTAINSTRGLVVNGLQLQNITGTGISVSGGVMSLSGVTASGISGSSVYFTSAANSVVIKDSNFNNSGTVHIVNSSSIQIADTNITNVRTGNPNALYAASSGDVTIDSVIIDGVPNGRGMYIGASNEARTLRISDSVIRNCTATQSGGGISITGGNAIISNSTIEDCTSTYSGGGIDFTQDGNLSIYGSTFRNLYANSTGGGICFYYSSNSNCTLIIDSLGSKRSEFINCWARQGAGAIDAWNAIIYNVSNTDFIDCTSDVGVRITNLPAHGFLINCRFADGDNTVTRAGPYFSPRGTFTNCIFRRWW